MTEMKHASCPACVGSLAALVTLAPRPYQEVGRDWLAPRRTGLLADQMRVGKTPQAILAAHKAGARRVLVLCPAIAVPQWRVELDRWGYTGEADIYSYQKALRLWRNGFFKGKTWDVFIPDECHYVRNPTAQRTRLVYGKGSLSWRAGATWSLSGTPAVRHAGELWPMLRAFGAVGMTYNDFLRRYCWFNADERIGGTKEKLIPELVEILDPVMLRRTRKEVAPELPELDFQYLNVEGQIGDLFSAFHHVHEMVPDADLLEWIEDNAEYEAEFRIMCALAKVPALAEEIENALLGKLLDRVVVFGHHVAPLETLAQVLSGLGHKTRVLNGSTTPKQRGEIQAEFKAGAFPVLCANITTAGTAIDLSSANHAYFLELSWLPADNLQAASRLISMTKAEPVSADIVTWPGSFDDRIIQVLMRRVRELAKLY